MTRARQLSRFVNASAFTIDSDYDVGINSTTPAGQLDGGGTLNVVHSSADATAASDANNLVLESASNVGMSFITGSDKFTRIKFGDSTSNASGKII